MSCSINADETCYQKRARNDDGDDDDDDNNNNDSKKRSNNNKKNDDIDKNDFDTMCPWKSLSDDVILKILDFVGPYQFQFVAAVNRQFCNSYKRQHGTIGGTSTSHRHVFASIPLYKVCIDCYDYPKGELDGQEPLVGTEPLIERAAEFGTLAVVQFVISSFKKHDESYLKRSPLICIAAARGGNLEVLRWLLQRGYAWNKFTWDHAAARGHLHVLQWAHDNQYHLACNRSLSYWDNISICMSAASNGHLHILKYVAERNENIRPRSEDLAEAAKNGHLDVVKWIWATGYAYWTVATSRSVVEKGQLHILKWAAENLEESKWNHNICATAAFYGHMHILEWARKNECPWDSAVCAKAALGGHLNILQWARANGCPWDSTVCASAAQGGHLNILQWARANGCPWDSHTCAGAAEGGFLEILKWARNHGCDWDALTCAGAAFGAHLNILKWARENGCAWDRRTCDHAVRAGQIEILQWARANGCEWDSDILNLALQCDIEIYVWARVNGCPLPPDEDLEEVGYLLQTISAIHDIDG